MQVMARRDWIAAVGVGTVALGLAIGPMQPASAAEAALVRVNLGAFGEQANAGVVDSPSVSADGRYVAFASDATNLVSGDTNDFIDVFVRDRQAGRTTRVSVSSSGAQAIGSSFAPAISANGRYVAFTSYAANLTAGDKNDATGGSDVFVRDLVAGTTVRISTPNKGGSSNGESDFPTISADGRYVAFDSIATNLVAGDGNKHGDVFRWDRTTGKLARISTTAAGKGAVNGGSGLASISANGNRVAFVSAATNLVSGDTNEIVDAFVKDLTTGKVVRVNRRADKTQTWGPAGEPKISADGTAVAFSTSDQLAAADTDWTSDVYVRDLGTGRTTLVSGRTGTGEGPSVRGDSYGAAISADGRYVAFTSAAGDLLAQVVGGGSQTYLKDLATGSVRLLSSARGGAVADDTSHAVAMSPDGAHLVFASNAQNLIRFDNNHAEDLFALDLAGAGYRARSMPAQDRYAADTVIRSGPIGEVPATDVRFEFGANEARVRFQYRVDGGAWKNAPAAKAAPKLAAGEHLVEVRAIDAAGNVDASPAAAYFTVV